MFTFFALMALLFVFCSPMAIYAYRAFIKEDEVKTGQWVFASVWIAFGIFLWIMLGVIVHVYTESLWFHEVGQTQVFWTNFWAKWRYFIGPAVLFASFWLVNVSIFKLSLDKDWRKKYGVITNCVSGSVGVIISIVFGLAIMASWQKFLLASHAVPFGITEPIFHRDLGFYIFKLPVLEIWRDALIWMIFLAMIAMVIAYVVYAYSQYNSDDSSSRNDYWNSSRPEPKADDRPRIWNWMLSHLSILGVLLMGAFIFATQISKWDVLYSDRGQVLGAGWTDVNIQLPAYNFFIAALIIAGLALFFSAIVRSLRATAWLTGIGFGLCVLVWLIGVNIWPAIIQHNVVASNELAKETPYIKYNIAFTRQAYGLDDEHITKSTFPADTANDSNLISKNMTTLGNVRLWKWQLLQAVNSQRQGLRPYYEFADVDVVRYNIDGKQRQIMYSARELDQEKLPDKAKESWLNRHFVFTHGYGACANPVNTVVKPEGIPDYWVKDFPIKSRYPELNIREPQIYFGEKTDGHVFTYTKIAEFDRPDGDLNVYSHYKGTGGIKIGDGFRRFAFAWRFDGYRQLMASELTSDSRIMFDREVRTRVKKIAPFLRLDVDPYQVVADGKLYFMIDAYTESDHYPYSEKAPGGKYNYIRNSVKVVINAYNGTVDFYTFGDDPIIRAWGKIYPGLLKSGKEMPKSLQTHIRYPEGLLKVQGQMYSVYHMDSVNVFYTKEAAWSFAKEATGEDQQEMSPYYVTMVMPGETKEEYVLMVPFCPVTTDESNKRTNLVGWMAGRCDGADYGKLVVYEFPKGRLIYGPAQFGSQINTDKVISKDVTMWNQQGSKVEWGDLLVIPLSDHRLLYVQPMFLRSTNTNMPQFTKVVVSTGSDKLAYADTFEEALAQLLGEEERTVLPLDGSTASNSVSSGGSRDLARQAAEHLANYQKLTGEGKLAEAGKEMESLRASLDQMVR